MKKLILTSPKFKGEIHAVYSIENQLLLFDVQHAFLTPQQVDYFAKHIPAIYDQFTFAESFGKSQLEVMAEDYAISFDTFWDAYDQKINRIRCEKLWNNKKHMSKADQLNAYTGIRKYNKHLSDNSWKTKADPETYLKNKYWLNEYK